MRNNELLSSQEASEYLGYSPRYLQRLARQKKIPAVRMRRRWRFYKYTLDEWLHQGCPSQEEQPSLFGQADQE